MLGADCKQTGMENEMIRKATATPKPTLKALIRDALDSGRFPNETAFAAAAGISTARLNQFKNGKSGGISPRLLPGMARALRVKESDLLPFLGERFQP